MPISRPLLIALIGGVVIGAAVLGTRGGDDDAGRTASLTPSVPETLQAADPPVPAGPPAPDGGESRDPKAPRSGTERAERPAKADRGEPGVPRTVSRALAQGKVAIVLLYQPGAADDSATLEQVRELEAARARSDRLTEESMVFTAPLTEAANYLGVTGALGVSRAPATAIIRPGGEVRLLEGYTDGRSLRQHLADALGE